MRDLGGSSVFGGRLPQVIAVFAATVSAIADGMHYGWTAPVIPLLLKDTSPVKIYESDVVWLENIYMLGGFSGLPLTVYFVDRFGRKKSILVAAVNNLISWILIGVATSVEYIYVARFLAGIAGDVAFVSAPMYIGEIADQKIRGFLGSIIYLMMLTGILIVYCVAPFVSIPISSSVGAFFVVIQLITFPFMPETPYHLLLKDKSEKAKKSLQILRSSQDVDKELEEISAAVERQRQEPGKPIDLLRVDSNRKGLIIMTVLNIAQHMSGFSVILMNIHLILQDAGSLLAPNTAAIIFAVILLIAATSAASFIDKAGRKVLLTSSCVLTAFSLIVLASYFAVKNSGTDISAYSWIPAASVMLFAATFKYGLGLVPIVLTAELFPTSVKAIGMTLSDTTYVLFCMASVYLYQHLAGLYGIHVPLFIFAGCCIISALFCLFYIPETKGRTLEDIQMILKGRKNEIVLKENACNIATVEGDLQRVNEATQDSHL